MKMLGIVAVGVVSESRKFSGHPRIRAHCAVFGIAQLSHEVLTDFTYRNLHGFGRYPGDSTALVLLLRHVA